MAKKFPTRSGAPGEPAVCHHLAMKTVDTHRWHYTERGRAKTTKFHCTWQHISEEHPEATPVEGTLIQRQEPEPGDLLGLIGRGNDGTKVG